MEVHDWFPARIEHAGGAYERARLLIAGTGRAVVWVLDAGKPVRVEDTTATAAVREGQQMLVTTAAGEWDCHKLGGCGCGNRLSRMRTKDLLS